MEAVVQRPGEGEALFGGRIVIKSGLEQLCITESNFVGAQPGADSHVHRRHADSFYVLEGELGFLVDADEHLLGAGACVCAPPGLVHAFRSTAPARFLTSTRRTEASRTTSGPGAAEPGGFDSIDAPPGSGLPGSSGILLGAGGGERLAARHRVATIKVGREELSLIEFELEPDFKGPDPHSHDDHVDSFYVLEGEAEFLVGDETLLLGAGSCVAAPPGVVHTFSSGGRRSRLLNVHAPSAGFHDWLRENS